MGRERPGPPSSRTARCGRPARRSGPPARSAAGRPPLTPCPARTPPSPRRTARCRLHPARSRAAAAWSRRHRGRRSRRRRCRTRHRTSARSGCPAPPARREPGRAATTPLPPHPSPGRGPGRRPRSRAGPRSPGPRRRRPVRSRRGPGRSPCDRGRSPAGPPRDPATPSLPAPERPCALVQHARLMAVAWFTGGVSRQPQVPEGVRSAQDTWIKSQERLRGRSADFQAGSLGSDAGTYAGVR
jgi:hypothetical protein